MSSVDNDVLAEIRNTFGRIAYTHKTQEKDAERKYRAASLIKVVNVVVIGVTTAAALLAPLLTSSLAAWFAAVSAILALMFSAFQLSFDPSRDANAHTLAAKSYLALRNDFRRLIADADDLDLPELRERRDQLAGTLEHLDRTAPPTSPQAYQQAREALRGTEELAFSDAEYRHLLGD